MSDPAPQADPLMPRVPKQARSRARFEAILDAAEALIADQGMAHLTMSEVAVRAGVPIGSLYQYMPTQQALVRALTDRFLGGWRRDIEHFVSEVDTPQALSDGLAAVLWRIYQDMKAKPQHREIWAHMHADRDLAAFDLADSRRNVARILDAAERVGALTDADRAERAVDTLLITHLSGNAMQVATMLSDDEGLMVVQRYVALSASLMGLPAPTSFPPRP